MAKEKKKYPKRIRADIERGFIIAYYELVRGLNASLDFEDGKVEEVVVLAWSPGLLIGMDFSSYYHFTEGQKPQTRLRHLRRKVDRLLRYGESLQGHDKKPSEVLYEIWCFIPPNDFVLQTAKKACEEGLPVELVDLGELHKRIQQTALIDPGDEEMVYANAFLWSASLLREARALVENSGTI